MNKKELIVITGASSGLGKHLLKSFSKSHTIINISRSESKCEYNIISDFSDLSGLKLKLEKNKIGHHLCILNAGTMGTITITKKLPALLKISKKLVILVKVTKKHFLVTFTKI